MIVLLSWLSIPDQPPAIAVELLDEVGIFCLKRCSDSEHNGENSRETLLNRLFKISAWRSPSLGGEGEDFCCCGCWFSFLFQGKKALGVGSSLGRFKKIQCTRKMSFDLAQSKCHSDQLCIISWQLLCVEACN